MNNKLRIVQSSPYAGLMLSSEVYFDQPISLLVGKNGSGKTRFFQSLKENCSKAYIDGSELKFGSDVALIPTNEIRPSYGQHHNYSQHLVMVNSTIAYYEANRGIFSEPLEPDRYVRRGMVNDQGLGYVQAHKLINFIAHQLNKQPDALTQEEIKLHFENAHSFALGNYDVANIFNRYLEKTHENAFNGWRKKEKGLSVPYYDKVEFEKQFGRRPWIVINEILNTVFEGKFHFPKPDEDSTTYSFQTPLLDNEDREISVGQLSSGETTLLWLALSLMNTQYPHSHMLSAPKLLLLDEPDAFLHPKMVEQMFTTLTEFCNRFNTIILLISHSPTTAALAPKDSIYLVESNKITLTDTDSAIAELLDGIPYIAIDPANRRQVYVESFYDSQIFQELFNWLKSKPGSSVNQKISVTFMSAGSKIPEEHIRDTAQKVFDIKDADKINEFILAINGSGNCDQVYGVVESLNSCGDFRVRGVVDWDTKNSKNDFVQVIGDQYAYAIENILLDPICILLKLYFADSSKYSIQNFCGQNISWIDWMNNEALLQASLDYFLNFIFGIPNAKNGLLNYRCGVSLRTDKKYLLRQGHNLESLLFDKYRELNRDSRQQESGNLKYKIVKDIMIGATNGDFIPSLIEPLFVELQK
jgi:ABC-type multidrug transport system ATPase subunit